MPELSVRFTAENEEAPLTVSLFRPGSGVATDPAPFEPPLGDPELADLRWYLETFSTWPTGPDYERAERIEARLEDWGRDLLASVTAEREAARLWQQFARVVDKLLTIDATDPRVLRLPWELLADDGGHLFAQGIGVRQNHRPGLDLCPAGAPAGAGFPARRRRLHRPPGHLRPLIDALADRGWWSNFSTRPP